MTETEGKTQIQKPKTSRLAKAAVVFMFLALLCLLVVTPGSIDYISVVLVAVPALSSIFLGAVALIKIQQSKGSFSGRREAILGIVVSIVLIFVSFSEVSASKERRQRAYRVRCAGNLSTFGKAFRLYAGENDGKYPTANKWCDLLLQYDIDEKMFVCRSSLDKGDMGRSHNAMNPYCESNSPNDVVLLFETKGGWNQFGGPELLTTENHHGLCHILFNDGSVDFIRAKEVGKLKWSVERVKKGAMGAEENGIE